MVTHYDYYETGFWIFKQEVYASGSIGSGFVIKETNSYYYILTNHHVIKQDVIADKEYIYVYDYDLNQYKGNLMFSSDKYDMAVVRITKNGSNNSLRVMELADYDPESGQTVIAIGQPQGQVNSVGIGKINRYVKISNAEYQVIEHSAYMDHGNSGGMLIDTDLKVVGINTWGDDSVSDKYKETRGYSSPVGKIKEFLQQNSFTL